MVGLGSALALASRAPPAALRAAPARAAALVPRALVLARAGGVRRARGGLARDRVGAAAVDDPRRDAHRRRGDAGRDLAVPFVALHRCSTSSSAAMVVVLLGAPDRARARRRGREEARRDRPLSCSRARCSAALVLYVLLGGADFGGGVWDLLAAGPRKAEQRALVERGDRADLGGEPRLAHPRGGAALHRLPAGLRGALDRALRPARRCCSLGIVLRGAAFTFRTYDRPRAARCSVRWGLVFSISSVVAPLVLGTSSARSPRAGSRAAARGGGPARLARAVPARGRAARAGALRVPRRVLPRRRGRGARCARTSGGARSARAWRCSSRRRSRAVLSWREAPLVFAGLTRRGFSLPLHLATGGGGGHAFAALLRRRVRLARAAAAAQAALIVAGWGASQYPYLVVPDVTLASAAAPDATSCPCSGRSRAGAVLLFPALYLLFRVFKGERPFSVVDRGR